MTLQAYVNEPFNVNMKMESQIFEDHTVTLFYPEGSVAGELVDFNNATSYAYDSATWATNQQVNVTIKRPGALYIPYLVTSPYTIREKRSSFRIYGTPETEGTFAPNGNEQVGRGGRFKIGKFIKPAGTNVRLEAKCLSKPGSAVVGVTSPEVGFGGVGSITQLPTTIGVWGTVASSSTWNPAGKTWADAMQIWVGCSIGSGDSPPSIYSNDSTFDTPYTYAFRIVVGGVPGPEAIKSFHRMRCLDLPSVELQSIGLVVGVDVPAPPATRTCIDVVSGQIVNRGTLSVTDSRDWQAFNQSNSQTAVIVQQPTPIVFNLSADKLTVHTSAGIFNANDIGAVLGLGHGGQPPPGEAELFLIPDGGQSLGCGTTPADAAAQGDFLFYGTPGINWA